MILSCDPGLKGAFCFYVPETGRMDIVKMPTLYRDVGRKQNKRCFIDEAEVFKLVTLYTAEGATRLVIEAVGGRPGQSASAAFAFGQGFGAVRMAAIANGLTVEQVPPSVWKAALQVPANKDIARARASQLIPTHAHRWVRKNQDGLAEAAMLALFAHREMTGKPHDWFAKREIERKARKRFKDNAERSERIAATKARNHIIKTSDDPELAKSLF